MRISAGPREARVLPVVIGVGLILFGLKAGGLAFGANAAQTAPAPNAEHAAPAAAPAAPAAAAAHAPAPPLPGADPTAAIRQAMPGAKAEAEAAAATGEALSPDLSDAGITPAQMDILTSLAERRDSLSERQRQLDLQTNLLAATEKRVDSKIAELKSLQAKIETLLDQRDAQEIAQLDGLVRVYSAMKPAAAARIFDNLDSKLRVSVAGRMKPDVIAGILSSLQPAVAQKLTLDLANRFKVDMPAAAPAPAPAPVPPPTAPNTTPQANAAPPANAATPAAPPAAPGG